MPYLIFGALVALLYIPGMIHIYPMADGSASVVNARPWPYDDLDRLHDMTQHTRRLGWPHSIGAGLSFLRGASGDWTRRVSS